MKRRNFCKTLIGAAVAAAIPGRAVRDVLIHKANLILPRGIGKAEAIRVMYGGGNCTEEMRQQMYFYQHASRIAFSAHRQQEGKNYFLQLGNAYHEELEKRVLAALDKKDQEQLKMLTDFEAAESWRRILPKQKRT